MRRYCTLVFLGLGVVFCILFWATDFAGSALGRHLVKGELEGFFQGDCSEGDQISLRLLRNLFRFKYSGPLITISERLSGLRLGVRVYPFRLEDKGGNLTFIEVGAWTLQVEVEGTTMWIMQDPEHSTMTVGQPIYNVNLLTVLAPLAVEQMVPGILPGVIPEVPVNFENKSIIDRVYTALNMTETIMEQNNYTAENNSLREIHTFLSLGGDAALAYRDSYLEVGKRQIAPKSKTVWTLDPLSLTQIHYHLPGLDNLTFEYWRSSESGVVGLSVDKYKVKDIWNPSILCQLSDSLLLNLYKTVQEYRVYLTSPGSIQSTNFEIITSEIPFAAMLDVYRPFATPIGGTAAVQVNFHIPINESFGSLEGETTPVMRVEVMLEELPDEVTAWLVTFIYVRTSLMMLFLILSCLFTAAAVISFIASRSQRRVRTHTLECTPL